ncbi:Pycsar system effector family protein [Kitasatospora sp. NPDC088391]|uniref:Pycsar system effector family protein n=1 Tax=Kitasatospora sp. NPDC088391 TaxID=3364074 RepID=UPI00380A4FC1
MTAARPERDIPAEQVLKDLLEQNFAEIGRADGKAGMLLALTVALLGLLTVGHGEQLALVAAVRWAACGAAVAALLSTLLALRPRLTGEPRHGLRTVAYFEDVRRTGYGGALAASVDRSAAVPRVRLARAVEGTSRIAHAKNRCLRSAVALLVPAVVALLCTSLLR